MDTQFAWREEFNIGVDIIDKEHRKLFKIINKLFAFKGEEKGSQWACQESIKFFKGHALKHFAEEEAYMESINYEGLERHRLIHNGFRDNTLPALEQELEQTEYSVEAVEHFLGVCAGWLIGHTLTEDLAITGKRVRKWEKLLPGEELNAMKKVIVQLVFDMFRLESHLISDAYGGEKFGQGVYCRLVYGTDQTEKRQEVFLVFEERLLINTVGKIMGIQTNKLDAMLTHATRYAARQFVKGVMEQFPSLEDYELKQENLLSFEQFQKVFDKKKLQASLLFDTGEGYFAYCMVAPHLLTESLGTPIGNENAISEIESYLLKRREKEADSGKPKVLVVDDSMTMRHAMKEMLSKDYEVLLVDSGVSAIREITLNRPDLILLDYEMPVCDGRQTLEMIRSEETFADIPVIFLTGRNDPESVKKVMSLKPAGYLLKHLKPEEIKNNIDTFFKKRKA